MKRFVVSIIAIIVCLIVFLTVAQDPMITLEADVGKSSHNLVPTNPQRENITTTMKQLEGETEASMDKNEVDDISKIIKKMTLDEKIGQLIIGGITGTILTNQSKKLIHTYKLGGFILFSANLEEPNQSLNLSNDLKIENKQNNIPLLLSVDQEGGTVTRLPNLYDLQTNEEIGLKNDKEFARKTGEVLGRQVKAFGFQVNFAPVIDVNNNPNNPVIGDRSFGSNPQLVGELGVEVMQGMQAEQVIPVIKHFPGLGDTHIDSHEELPVIDKNMDELEAIELVPFKTAIDAGADVVMTAHIKLPQIGDDPATLSYEIITGILREELHFDGVIMTDDLTMGAISNNYKIGEAAVHAIKAGVDIVLVAHNYENITAVFEQIKASVLAGEITESRIEESVKRILLLKEEYEIVDTVIEEINVDVLNKEIVELYE
ncbi:beta-N-acetylhexosaminidase [Pseudogracilibacillus sp. SO30301A]|uniref:beta-N-acetylhexosaminidase n=1 Tax=Pseudogracilibacillus sp. SO30301A TaxID=3098291 RepID=UPI00300DF180